jgi:hypothetical protein
MSPIEALQEKREGRWKGKRRQTDRLTDDDEMEVSGRERIRHDLFIMIICYIK